MASTLESGQQYGIGQHALSIGYSCWCRIGTSANDAQKVGMVDSMRATKNIQLQRANVCGAIMPASIDPQGISVNLNLSGFIPVPKLLNGGVSINGMGVYTLQSFNPDSDDFVKGNISTKAEYMDFYDEATGVILASFKFVIPSSFGITIQGGSYVKADVGAEALYMGSEKDFVEQA